jgi:hypothetical protein
LLGDDSGDLVAEHPDDPRIQVQARGLVAHFGEARPVTGPTQPVPVISLKSCLRPERRPGEGRTTTSTSPV